MVGLLLFYLVNNCIDFSKQNTFSNSNLFNGLFKINNDTPMPFTTAPSTAISSIFNLTSNEDSNDSLNQNLSDDLGDDLSNALSDPLNNTLSNSLYNNLQDTIKEPLKTITNEDKPINPPLALNNLPQDDIGVDYFYKDTLKELNMIVNLNKDLVLNGESVFKFPNITG